MSNTNKAAQLDMIWAALTGGESLTALQALARFGCNRLAARIDNLRRAMQEPWDEVEQCYKWIESQRVKTSGGKTVAQYQMTREGLARFANAPRPREVGYE